MDYKEKLKAIINSDNTPFVDIDTFLKYFPELKESEDERTRKFIIHLLDNHVSNQVSRKDIKECITWLEKQGKQKPTDKVEPKFYEGDWIIRNNDTGVPVQVLEFKGYYRCDLNGEVITLTLNDVHNNFHLWTIQDAKDGDVLAADLIKGYSSPFVAIYKERGLDFFNSYCFVSFDGIFFKEGCTGHDTRVHPATKEQRDLLFQKMKEAGYEWDSENKELKKIEQKLAWSEEDERNLQDIDSVLFYDKCISENTCMRLRNWLKSLKERYIWKPREEQMEALLYEVNAWDEDSINGQNLKSLYQDLKKLKA